MTRIIGILVLGSLLVGLLFFSQQPPASVVVSGFGEADEIRVGSRVGGRMQTVHANEGDTVSAGDTLVRLEPFDLHECRAELEQRRNQVSAVYDKLTTGFRPEELAQVRARQKEIQAQVDTLRSGPRPQAIAAADTHLRLAEAELSLADNVCQRTETLFVKQSVNKNQPDETATRLRVVQTALDASCQQLAVLLHGSRKENIARAEAQLEEAGEELALRENDFRSEEIREAKARLDSADAALQAIERQLDELKITAPCG